MRRRSPKLPLSVEGGWAQRRPVVRRIATPVRFTPPLRNLPASSFGRRRPAPAVDAEVGEPATARRGLDPAPFLSGRRRAEMEIDRGGACRVLQLEHGA